MKPTVLLVNLPYIVHNIDANRSKIRSFLAFPLGLLSVATYNKDLANFTIIDCDTLADYESAIMIYMRMWKPKIVGFSMMFDNSYPHLERILSIV
ncbi:hypothetical protein EHM76_01015, partial [bacterium]